MADRPRSRLHRFTDRAAKRGAEPATGAVRLAHWVNGLTTASALDIAGLHVSDSPARTLTVIAVTTLGSAAVGSVHERRGWEAGRQEGLETGRRLGRASAMLEQSRQLRARQGRFGRRQPPTRNEPGSRGQGGR